MTSHPGFRIITPGPRILMVNPHNFQIRMCECFFNDPLRMSMISPLFTLRHQPENHQNLLNPPGQSTSQLPNPNM